MPFKVIRRDLTETTRKCDYCYKYLTSLKTYVLKDLQTGDESYAGPKCAKNIAGENALSGVLDLTKFTTATQNSDRVNVVGAQGGRATDDPEQKALLYLILREDKLVNELNCSYKILKDYYSKSKKEALSESDINHVNNIAAKIKNK